MSKRKPNRDVPLARFVRLGLLTQGVREDPSIFFLRGKPGAIDADVIGLALIGKGGVGETLHLLEQCGTKEDTYALVAGVLGTTAEMVELLKRQHTKEVTAMHLIGMLAEGDLNGGK